MSGSCVRNSLGLKADNKEIDALFDSLDADGGGSIDPKEMAIALKFFESKVQAADDKEAASLQLAAELREDSALVLDCDWRRRICACLQAYARLITSKGSAGCE